MVNLKIFWIGSMKLYSDTNYAVKIAENKCTMIELSISRLIDTLLRRKWKKGLSMYCMSQPNFKKLIY